MVIFLNDIAMSCNNSDNNNDDDVMFLKWYGNVMVQIVNLYFW